MEDVAIAPSMAAVAKPLIATLLPGEFPHVGAAHRPTNQEQPEVDQEPEMLQLDRFALLASQTNGFT